MKSEQTSVLGRWTSVGEASGGMTCRGKGGMVREIAQESLNGCSRELDFFAARSCCKAQVTAEKEMQC